MGTHCVRIAATLDGLEERLGDDSDQVLLVLDTTPGMSQGKIAEAIGWVTAVGPRGASSGPWVGCLGTALSIRTCAVSTIPPTRDQAKTAARKMPAMAPSPCA